MRQSHLIIYNGAVTYGLTFAQGVAGFFLVPYIVTRLGKESYGIVLLAMSVMPMVDMFGSALSKAVTKYVATEKARDEMKQLNTTYSSSLLWFLLVGVLGATAVALAGLQFSRLFPDTSAELARDGQLAMYIMAGTIVLCLAGNAWKGVLAGVQRYDIISALSSSRTAFRVICVVGYFTLVGPDLLPVVVIFAASHVLERLGLAVACHRIVPGLRASPTLVTRLRLSIIAGFATFLLLATMGNVLVTHVLRVVIGRELGLSAIADYGVAVALVTFANGLIRSIVSVIMPVASKYQELGNDGILRKLVLHGTKHSVIVGLACFGVTAPLLPDLYRIWIGDDFVGLSGMTLVMFAGQTVISSSTCSSHILSGLGRVKYICAVSLGWASVTFVTVWCHLHFWPGATLMSTVTIMVIGRSIGAVALIAYGMRVTRAAWRQLLVQSYLKPLLVCSGVAAVGLGAVHVLPVATWSSLIAVVALLELLFLGICAWWCLDGKEKQLAMQLIRRFMRPLPAP